MHRYTTHRLSAGMTSTYGTGVGVHKDYYVSLCPAVGLDAGLETPPWWGPIAGAGAVATLTVCELCFLAQESPPKKIGAYPALPSYYGCKE